MILFICIIATISLLWGIALALQPFPNLDAAALASLFAAVLSLGGLMLAELSKSPDCVPTEQKTPAVSCTALQLAQPNPSGYAMIQTFILETETGVSLKAAGWTEGHTTKAEKWNRPSRAGRREDQPNCPKVHWYKHLAK